MTKSDSIISLVIAATTMFVWSNSIIIVVDAQEKIDAAIDLVVTWPTNYDEANFASPKRELAMLPDMFVMGDDKVKIAVVEVNDWAHDPNKVIVWPLSSDENGYKNWLKQWQPKESLFHHFHSAFEAARTRIFAKSEKHRARMLLVVQWLYASQSALTDIEAAKLRDAGVHIFVVTQRHAPCDKDGGVEWSGGESRCIQATDEEFHKMMTPIRKLKNVMLRDLCNWKTACRYDQSQKCIPDFWQFPKPTSFENNAQCEQDGVKPTAPKPITCNNVDCDDECNRQWPPIPDCNTTCGVTSKRVGVAPQKMDHCPIKIVCSTCPPTTIVTETSAARASESSTDAASKNATAAAFEKSTDAADSKFGDATDPKPEISAVSIFANNHIAGAQGNQGVKQEEDKKKSFPWLVVGALIGIVALICLIAVIAVVAVKKKKKRAAASSKNSSRIESTKSTEISPTPPPMPPTPSPRTAKSTVSTKSADSDAEPAGFWFHGEKAADTSVFVDMDETDAVSRNKTIKKGSKSESKPAESTIKKSSIKVESKKQSSIKEQPKSESAMVSG